MAEKGTYYAVVLHCTYFGNIATIVLQNATPYSLALNSNVSEEPAACMI